MNEFLNNVFTDESVDAIKNAHKISPSPEQRTEVEYEEPQVEHVEVSISENTQVGENTDNQKIIRAVESKLLQEIAKQSERISTIVASQNEMIGELHKIQEKIAELEKQPKVQAQSQSPKTEEVKSVKTEKKEQKQQTGAGEGLNPQDYSVEDLFYFGNK